MKKILLILALICMIAFPVLSQSGTYTTYGNFYMPPYGGYGVDEFNEYNAYMQIADTQIEANKTMGEASVDTSGTPIANDIPRFTDANTIEGLSYAELKVALDLEIGTDLQAWDAQLDDISALAYANSNFIVGDGSNWVAESGATARASLGLTIGTNVQAYDAGLLSIAGLTTSANKSIYTTALDTYEVYSLTSFARTILDDADASTVKSTLGIDLSLYYLKTAIDTESEMEAIWGVGLVTDATACTDLEGTLLSIATGTLNVAIPEDHITATMLKDDNSPADEDVYSYESTGPTGHWYSRAEVGIGVATSITDGLIVKADFAASTDFGNISTDASKNWLIDDDTILEADLKAVDASADEDILTKEDTTGDFEWHSAAELGIGTATAITDGLIVEADLSEVGGSPTDEDILTYEHDTTNFEWHTLAELSIQPLESTLTDIADGTINEDLDNTTNPWADNEVADNITIDLSTLATTFTVTDNENEALACLILFVDGATGAQGAESDGDFTYNPSTGTLTVPALDLTTALPDAEVANNITIDLATLATTITVTDNESTNENNPICFVAGADPDGGSLGIETDGTMTYNPSTGVITTTGFAGALTGNVTGNASGSSGSCTGLAATATALATARTIGGISFDGTANIIPRDSTHDHALGSDEDYSGILDTAPVGENVTIGALLYYDWTAVEWMLAQADAVGTTPAMRIALEDKGDGQDCLMLVQGYIRDDDAFDFGAARIFLNDDNAGTCDDTAPAESGDQIQVVGIGLSADTMYFCPSIDVGEI